MDHPEKVLPPDHGDQPLKAPRSEGKANLRDIAVLVLSVFVLSAMLAELLLPLPDSAKVLLEQLDTLICFFFLADFGIGLYRAPSKLRFMKWGWIDLISSIPMMDAFRWGRVFRMVRILRAIRSTRHIVAHLYRHRTRSLLGTALFTMLTLVTFSSLAVLTFEDGLDSTIRTPFDAVWWSISTITTVGYGDKYPLSVEGKLVAMVLMVAGVGLFGVLTGLFARLFVEPDIEKEEVSIRELAAEIRLLRQKLETLESKSSDSAGTISAPIISQSNESS